jgi:catalase
MLGKMTLNRNPDNFFTETEQVAFCVSHLVPGIDVTNDPLMQARLFSYLDTQLSRLGGPNFAELPINKSIAPVVNNQRDGHMRHTIDAGQSSYEPNSLGGGCPFQAGAKMGGYVSYPQPVEGTKIRERSDSFMDHFSQATMFYNSQMPLEQEHIIEALRFELGKCEHVEIRERMVGVLEQIDAHLAKSVAAGLGIKVPVKIDMPLNRQIPADANADSYQPTKSKPNPKTSPALSIIRNLIPGVNTKKVAILVADGFDKAAVKTMMTELSNSGAMPKIVAVHGGTVDGVHVDFSLNTVRSVLFDALFVPGGESSIETLESQSAAALFVIETYKHCKAICASGEGATFVRDCLIRTGVANKATDKVFASANGMAISDEAKPKELAAQFIEAMSKHRAWDRLKTELVIA